MGYSLNPTAANAGLAGAVRNPGWISMNMLRDLATFYRGMDRSNLSKRYWESPVTTNTRATHFILKRSEGPSALLPVRRRALGRLRRRHRPCQRPHAKAPSLVPGLAPPPRRQARSRIWKK